MILSAIIGTDYVLVTNYYTFAAYLVFWSDTQLKYENMNELLPFPCTADMQRAVTERPNDPTRKIAKQYIKFEYCLSAQKFRLLLNKAKHG